MGMWTLDHKESWMLKNWCFWTVVLQKTLASPLDSKEINPVNPKRNQFWIFIGRTDAEAEAPILWPPNVKNGFIGKDPDAGKDWRREEKGTTEDEMVAWHHQLKGHEFEQAPGVGDGQGNLVCCSPWGHKELDTTEWMNWLTGSQKRFTKVRNTLKRKRPGAPLDLRHPILKSPTGVPGNFDSGEQADGLSNRCHSSL